MLKHNEVTLEELDKYTSEGKSCCIVNPCGSGKTQVISEFIKKNSDKKFIMLTKQKNASDYYHKKNKIFNNIKIKTYSMMLSDYKHNRLDDYNVDYLIADEAHYIGADKWEKAFDSIKERFDPIVIGLTATPQRYFDQGTSNTIVTRKFNGNSAGNFTTADLQKDGTFVEPEYILSIYKLGNIVSDKIKEVKDSILNNTTKNRLISRLKFIYADWNKNYKPEVIIREHLKNYLYKDSSNRILVYTPNIDELEELKENIDSIIKKSFGDSVKSYVYTYKNSEKELKSFLRNEKNTYIKILYSIDKIMETIHIDDISVAIMLRPSVSNRIIIQQFGRVNSINNKKKSLIIDMVNNLSNINKIGVPAENKASHSKKNIDNKVDGNINISYIQKYRGVFDAVDSAISKANKTKYKGFVGGLHQVCKVYNRDYYEVKKLMNDFGYDIEEAISKARDLQKTQVTSEVMNGCSEIPEFTLNEHQKEIANTNINVVEDFIYEKEIQDDDIKQSLFMRYLYEISNMQNYDARKMSVSLVNEYMRQFKIKVEHEKLYDERNINDIRLEYSMDNAIELNNVAEILYSTIAENLSEREKYILYEADYSERSLTNIGKELGLTSGRIGQIYKRALVKLRRKSKKLRDSSIDITEAEVKILNLLNICTKSKIEKNLFTSVTTYNNRQKIARICKETNCVKNIRNFLDWCINNEVNVLDNNTISIGHGNTRIENLTIQDLVRKYEDDDFGTIFEDLGNSRYKLNKKEKYKFLEWYCDNGIHKVSPYDYEIEKSVDNNRFTLYGLINTYRLNCTQETDERTISEISRLIKITECADKEDEFIEWCKDRRVHKTSENNWSVGKITTVQKERSSDIIIVSVKENKTFRDILEMYKAEKRGKR